MSQAVSQAMSQVMPQAMSQASKSPSPSSASPSPTSTTSSRSTFKILIIKGVFLSDLNAKPKPIITRLMPTDTIKVYNDLPREFTGISDWPKRTNLKCWHCDKIPEDYPRFLPVCPQRNQNDDKFHCGTKGVFHSWNCVAAYIDAYVPASERREARQLLCFVESIFSGRRRIVIPAAPARTDMREYSGDTGLSRAEYEAKLAEVDTRGSIYG